MDLKGKRNSRIRAIQTLYNIELLDSTVAEALADASSGVDDDAKDLIVSVMNAQPRIDEIISSSLTNYSIDRLSYVDRAIIRVATFEMLNGLSPNIAINEALEITKVFSDCGDGKARAFNNKLLDTISKAIGD